MSREPDRRTVMRLGLAGAFGVALPGAAAVAASRRGRSPSGPAARTAPASQFLLPLPIPQVLRPVSRAGGVDRYEIRQVQARQQVRANGPTTPIWGYNGVFPGPTIEVRRGRRIIVTHRNELPVPTVVHLHGGAVPAASDGYPTDFVVPVGTTNATPGMKDLTAMGHFGVAGVAIGTRAHEYPNDQAAATLWYHDHRMNFTGPQVCRGLAGFYLIRDDVEDSLPLPRGAREIPLMLTDRTFNDDGTLFYPSVDPTLRTEGVRKEFMHGWLGKQNVVNGVLQPYHEVDAALYRLRICNASSARPYSLKLDPPPPDGPGLVQIGSDLGLLGSPVKHDVLFISPGERYDVLVDFGAYPLGTKVILKNDLELGQLSDLVRFDVVRRAADDARIPDTLVPDIGGPPARGPGKRSFNFTSGPEGNGLPSMINFQPFTPDRIDAQVADGDTELWNITADANHPVHLHMAHFRVVSRNGGPPGTQDGGWKDTVFVNNNGVQVAVTPTGHRGKTVFHCHNMEHGDNGMMANMEIV